MQRKVKLGGVAMVGLLALSACVPKSPCELAPPSDRVAAAGQMTDCLGTLNQTPVAMMPTSGTAQYNGYVTGTFTPSAGASDTLIGDAALTVNFGTTKPVTGTLSNFASGSDPALGGTLAVSSGAILGNVFLPSISGTLTGYGTANDSLTFSTGSGAVGGFFGDNAEVITIADTAATVTVSGTGYNGTAGLAIVATQP